MQVVKHTECCQNCLFCQQKRHSGDTYQNYQLLLAFPKGALNIIKSKDSHMNEQEKICTLCMDEISLKTNLFYDIPGDKIVGLEDFGSNYRTNKVATSALVFLVRSITGNWKQPLGYVFVNGACDKDETERLMKEAIDKLDVIGLKVLVILSDMGSNFHSLVNHLNITPENPWFIHNNTVQVCILRKSSNVL